MTVDRNVRFDQSSQAALVVFALNPNMVLTLIVGTDDGVSWHCSRSSHLPVRVRPQDGFVVAWLPPTTGKQRYAIAKLSTDTSELTSWKAKEQILAFDAVPGQVNYLGGLTVEFARGELSGIVDDPAITDLQAEAFVASRFANVSAPLVKQRMDWLHLDGACWFDRLFW